MPAGTEGDARRIATETNRLGQDWRDQARFVADGIVTTESHVIGDIICQTSRRRPEARGCGFKGGIKAGRGSDRTRRKVAELSAARDEIERSERAERKGGRT